MVPIAKLKTNKRKYTKTQKEIKTDHTPD